MQPSIIYFYLLSIWAIEHKLYSIKANISQVRFLKEGLRQPGEGYSLLSIRLFVSHVFSIETPRATHLARPHHERCVSDAITVILISYGLATLTKPQWRSQKNTQRFDRESIGTTDAKKMSAITAFSSGRLTTEITTVRYPLANKPRNIQCGLHAVSEFIPRSTWPPSTRFTFSRDGNHDNFRVVGYWLGRMKKTRLSPALFLSAKSASAVRFSPKSSRQGKMHIGYNALKNISKMIGRLVYLKVQEITIRKNSLIWLFE